MELNRIKLWDKKELLEGLKQGGYDEVVNILENKDITGETLINLKEFEIFKWKLTPAQKKTLWTCVNQIKASPHILIATLKPKLPAKGSLVKGRPVTTTKQPITKVKQSSNSERPNVSVVRSPSTSSDRPKFTKNENKVERAESFNRTLNKPIIRERTQSNAEPFKGTPRKLEKEDNNKEFKDKLGGLLSGIGPNTSGASTFPKIRKPENQPSFLDDGKVSSKPLPPLPPPSPPPRNEGPRRADNVKKPPVQLPKENTDDMYLQMHAPNQSAAEDGDDYLTPINRYKQGVKKKSPLLPKRTGSDEKNLKTNKPAMTAHSHRRYLQDSEDMDDQYELSPPFNEFDNRGEYKQSPAEPPENTKENRKIGIKDLTDVIIIDGVTSQPEPMKFSFLKNIFKPTKAKNNNYENVEIKVEKVKPVEKSDVKNRPLPQIPSSPKELTKTKSLFLKPFPPPRDLTHQDNYIELTKTIEKSERSAPQISIDDSEDDSQIYTNTQPIHSNAEQSDDEPSEIYINTSEIHQETLMVIRQNESRISKHSDEDEGDQIYENTSPNPPNKRGQIFTSTTSPKTSENAAYKTHTTQQFQEKTTNISVDGRPQSLLAALLSEKLKERELRLGFNETEMNVSDTDSEFEDDDDDNQIYGNVPNHHEDETLSVISDDDGPSRGESPEMNDKHIPIFRRALPEIPIASSSSAVTKDTNNSTTEIRPRKPKGYEMHTMGGSTDYKKKSAPTVADKAEEKRKSNINIILNLNNEPFYRNTDRKGAKQLLSKLGNGAFLFRPSRTYFLVLTVKHGNRIYNFGIERGENNMLRLNTEGNLEPPEFPTLREFVAYFTQQPITFGEEDNLMEIYLKKLLPPNLF